MPIALGVAGLLAGAWLIREGAELTEDLAKLAKWSAIGGGLYVGYRVARGARLIK